jgi:hypothetical protein
MYQSPERENSMISLVIFYVYRARIFYVRDIINKMVCVTPKRIRALAATEPLRSRLLSKVLTSDTCC